MDEFLAAVIQLYTVYPSLLIFETPSMYLAKAYGHTRILTELQWEFWNGKIDGFASKCDSKIDSQWLREIIWFFLNCFFYPMWSKLWLNCGWEWPLLSKMLKLAVDTETGLGVTWFWLFLSCLVLFFFFHNKIK